MEVQPDFRDLLELFNKHQVEFMLVGGYALAFHSVSYIGRDQFVSNKKATGRQKDLADLEALGEE